MKRTFIFTISLLLCMLGIAAQNATVKGRIADRVSDQPVAGVTVTLLGQQINTLTNSAGEFQFVMVAAGDDEIRFSAEGYFPQIKTVKITENQTNDLGKIVLIPDAQADARQDILLQISESQLNDEGRTQVVSASTSSASDIYLSQTGYSFSPMRFRTRGYDNKYESTYINGVHFLDAERGGFNYSSIGGMNNATKNKDMVYGLIPNTFAFGNIGANTNINTRASSFATGSNANVALSNRSYKIRGQYTYGTGVLNNGWAFAISGIIRWSDDNKDALKLVEGTFYNSAGLFLSAEKIFNDKHSLSLVAFGAPTRRAGQAAITKEARDLTGSIYYNPYWGYQNDKVRNSRIYKTFDPTTVLSHDWKITNNQQLRTGLGFHYSWYSNSTFAYNGMHPAPDYYRYMPSFTENDITTHNKATSIWEKDQYMQQIKWGEIYRANKLNNDTLPEGQAAYALIRRHNNLMETSFNSIYTNSFNPNLKFTAGVEGRLSKGMHYQTIDDLLGANQVIDRDTYADRDLTTETMQDVDPRFAENDLNDKNKKKHEGDIWGYNYSMNVQTANAYAQIEYKYE
ncbi:MAG: carboxypeptidase-like regulatory domain-containing protein, partial [Paludibacter sp.]|nr:carboxypeptidase-like regulatory domain-containing protein [Paludibacter sp.]